MPNLIDSLMGMVDGNALAGLAGNLGEPQGAVEKALKAGAAAMLGSIGQRAGDTNFLGSLMGLLNNPALSGNLLGNVGSLLGGGSALSGLGSQFLGLLFGGQQSAITDLIGRAAGMKSSSASSLMGMAAPLVMAFLGSKVKSEGLNAAGLGKLIGGEMSSLQSLLPSGMGSLLSGLAMPSMPKMPAAPEVTSSGRGWLLPLLLVAAGAFGLLWFLNQGTQTVKDAAHDAAATVGDAAAKAGDTATNVANSAWAALGEFFKRRLPNGIELNIPQLGVENRLVDFIEGSAPVDKTTWFDFDRLLFDTGKATLQPASQDQLKNVAEILKAFPNVNIKIGGYTDNTGNAAANLSLSDARAKAVVGELVTLGIDKGRLDAEGYGDQYPVASNDTEEGRQKNRRVSMRVTKK
jgi:outer membrane protein OmpA-like peptidoglycan-associated protein